PLQGDRLLRARARARDPLERPGDRHRVAAVGRARALGQGRRRPSARQGRSVSVKLLVTGARGQVGWELQRSLAPLGEIVALDRAALYLSDPDRIVSVVRATAADVIVNAAAYTAVDRAEAEPEAAFAVNARAPGILAEEAKRLGALLVHYSTDYVCDGAKPAPYVEDDRTGPLNVYGASKLAGERAVLQSGAAAMVLRTSWVYA